MILLGSSVQQRAMPLWQAFLKQLLKLRLTLFNLLCRILYVMRRWFGVCSRFLSFSCSL
jgi:hypothetical protein